MSVVCNCCRCKFYGLFRVTASNLLAYTHTRIDLQGHKYLRSVANAFAELFVVFKLTWNEFSQHCMLSGSFERAEWGRVVGGSSVGGRWTVSAMALLRCLLVLSILAAKPSGIVGANLTLAMHTFIFISNTNGKCNNSKLLLCGSG